MDHVVESDPVPERSRAPVAVVEVVNVAVVENEAEAVNDHVIENEAVDGTFMCLQGILELLGQYFVD